MKNNVVPPEKEGNLIVDTLKEQDQASQLANRKSVETNRDKPYLSLIIPAYNEATRLPGTIDTVLNYLQEQAYTWEFLIVDDGSDDETVDLVEKKISGQNNVTLIRNPHRGKGYTVRTGMLTAKGQYVIFSDADLSTPIKEVAKLLNCLENGYDVAIGSREAEGANRIAEPFHRHLMGRVFNLFTRILTVQGIDDTQCGFKGFTFTAAQDLFKRLALYADNARAVSGAMVTGFDVEVLFLAQKKGYRIREVPVEWQHFPGSKVNPLKDSWRMVQDIVKVRLNDLRGFYDH